MKLKIWITWWIIFFIRYLRLFWVYNQKHGKLTNNPPIRIYVNKIENKITFTIKTKYYLKFLTPETIKLLESTQNKITKNENGENIPHLKSLKQY